MSTIKSPQQKKKLSLEHDRRNTYGENSKSSRKNIAKRKKLGRKSARRASSSLLASANQLLSEDDQVQAELDSTCALMKKRRAGFTKIPDKPLGAVLEQKAKTTRTKYNALGTPLRWQKPKLKKADS